MNVRGIESTKFIFFLQLGASLPREYFKLVSFFKELNIVLVPVKPYEFIQLSAGTKQHVISFVYDLSTQKTYTHFRRKFLDFALQSHQVYLYEFSSFSELEGVFRAKKAGHYHYFALPLPIEEAVQKVSSAFYKQTSEVEKWPGGKRAKLPHMPKGGH